MLRVNTRRKITKYRPREIDMPMSIYILQVVLGGICGTLMGLIILALVLPDHRWVVVLRELVHEHIGTF